MKKVRLFNKKKRKFGWYFYKRIFRYTIKVKGWNEQAIEKRKREKETIEMSLFREQKRDKEKYIANKYTCPRTIFL